MSVHMMAPTIHAATQTHTQKLPISWDSGVIPLGTPNRIKSNSALSGGATLHPARREPLPIRVATSPILRIKPRFSCCSTCVSLPDPHQVEKTLGFIPLSARLDHSGPFSITSRIHYPTCPLTYFPQIRRVFFCGDALDKCQTLITWHFPMYLTVNDGFR